MPTEQNIEEVIALVNAAEFLAASAFGEVGCMGGVFG
jgi:hypothetical protein